MLRIGRPCRWNTYSTATPRSRSTRHRSCRCRSSNATRRGEAPKGNPLPRPFFVSPGSSRRVRPSKFTRLHSYPSALLSELDRTSEPYAGVHRMTALEFLARWVDHVPERYEVRVRCAGANATRRRVWWRQRGIVLARACGAPPEVEEPEASWRALRARRRRWAELSRKVFRVDVEVCARCGSEARIIGFVTEPAAIRRTLAHLERRGVDSRAGPWVGASAAPG